MEVVKKLLYKCVSEGLYAYHTSIQVASSSI